VYVYSDGLSDEQIREALLLPLDRGHPGGLADTDPRRPPVSRRKVHRQSRTGG
jgi:hypothetical protein